MKYKTSFILAIISTLLICNTCHAEFYRYNIDELARKAKARLQEIDKKITEEKTTKELQDILAKLQSLYDERETADSIYLRHPDGSMEVSFPRGIIVKIRKPTTKELAQIRGNLADKDKKEPPKEVTK